MSLLYLDLETIASGSPDDITVKVPANYRKQETIDKYIEDNKEEQWRKGSLNGFTGEIISLAWAIDDDDVTSLFRRPGEPEADLLKAFFDQLILSEQVGDRDYRRFTFIGHNVIGFDCRFLLQRCWVNNVKPPVQIPADARHGTVVFDTMKEAAGYSGFISMDALAKALGLEGKQGMTGADVWPAYQKGEYDKIQAYNESDVETVREIYKRLVWK